MAPLFPDPETRRTVTGEQPRLPLSCRPSAVSGSVVTVNPGPVRSRRTAPSGQVR